MSNEQQEAAIKLANYFWDDGVHLIDYSDHCDRGLDPRNHILWQAATVLNILDVEGFTAELEAYQDKLWKSKQPKA